MNSTNLFHVTKERSATECKVYLKGELDLSAATDLVEELQPLIAQTELALVLDLGRLQYIDSTGIGILVSTLKSRAALRAPFAVRNVPPKIKRLFDLTGISRHLSVAGDAIVEEGVGSSNE